MADDYELIGSKGCGSAVVEIALELAGLPWRLTDLPYLEAGPGRDRLLRLNPLGQVPTLVLPDGMVMTESAAMLLHIAEIAPKARLAPAPATRERAAFLDLLILIVAAIYPTATFGDDPARWTHPGPAADRLRQTADGRRIEIWRRLDDRLIPDPFVFGENPTLVDLYLAVMTRWRPGRAWFEAEAPNLVAVANAVEGIPAAARIIRRNFPA